ncbi:MAG: ABC transporter substrate-binding protein [Pirellulales bacterium]
MHISTTFGLTLTSGRHRSASLAATWLAHVTLLAVIAVLTGCGGSSTPEPQAGSSAEGPASGAKEVPAESGSGEKSPAAIAESEKKPKEKGPFKLGDLVDPFDPPTLEEIEKTAEWVDLPVVDSMALLRDEYWKDRPAPKPLTEVLALRNSTAETNETILNTLGRLPADDKQVDWDASINRHTAADVKSTNPLLASSTIEFDVGGLIGFGLFSFDWRMRPFAAKDSVVSWQTSKDRMYDKVVLRDDLTWSDGKPVTAHDVEFSYLAIMTKSVPASAQRSGTDKLKYVKAYDDRTVIFFHKEPFATNAWNVNFSIIPKHVYETTIADDPTLQDSEAHVALERNPVTGGPYTISSRTRDQEIVLTRRDSYYTHNGKQVRDKPYFKQIRFKVMADPSVALLGLKAGDIDELQLSPDLWKTQTGNNDFYERNTKVYAVEWVEFHFLWNCERPYFSDKRVRQALALAFDHDELIQKLRHGIDQPSSGMFNAASQWSPPGFKAGFQKRDLEKAEELLEAADWVDHDEDGIRDKMVDGKKVKFEFQLQTSNRPDRIAICNLLKENLEQIGIAVNVRPLEFTVMTDNLLKHNFDAAFGGWGTGTDPDTTDNIFGTGQDRNYGQYSNKEIDKLYELGRREFDVEKRLEIYRKIHTLLYEDQPYMWLYYQNAYYAFNKELRGYVFSPRGPFNYGPGFGSIWRAPRL